MNIDVFADASVGNVEDGKTQIGFYVRLRDGKGNTCPIILKSKVARRVIGSTLIAEVAGMIEAVEWAEYIKFLWIEIIDGGK